MKRRWKILIGIVGVLAVLLAVNATTSDNETREAEVTVEGGRILELSRGAVQVADSGEPAGRDAGQPVVLLHCYACSLHWYDSIEPLLAERHRVIRIDLLGFGGSEKPESGYEIENQAAVVAEALNELGVEGALVAGHEMGGAVATSLAEQASQLVDRVVMINAAPSGEFGDRPFLARIAYTPVIGEAMWRLTPDFVVRDTLAEAFAPGYDIEEGFEGSDQIVEDYRAMTYTSFDEAPSAADDFRDEVPLDDRLTRAAVPLLVIFGAEDQILDAESAVGAYSEVPGVRTELLEGLGNSPQVEDPQAVAELLEGFALDLPERVAGRPPQKQRGKGKGNRGNAGRNQNRKRN